MSIINDNEFTKKLNELRLINLKKISDGNMIEFKNGFYKVKNQNL